MNTKTVTPESTSQDIDLQIKERHYGIYWIIFGASVLLLCLLPSEAAWVATNRGWYIQPMFGAGLGIALVAMFALIRIIQSIRCGYLAHLNLVESLTETVASYRTALFSAALFFLYINTLSVLGFVLSTLVFVTTLLWLSRLLNRTWFLATLGTLTAMVLIFRVAVSVWMPDVWLYNLLPDTWADFANQYL